MTIKIASGRSFNEASLSCSFFILFTEGRRVQQVRLEACCAEGKINQVVSRLNLYVTQLHFLFAEQRGGEVSEQG